MVEEEAIEVWAGAGGEVDVVTGAETIAVVEEVVMEEAAAAVEFPFPLTRRSLR